MTLAHIFPVKEQSVHAEASWKSGFGKFCRFWSNIARLWRPTIRKSLVILESRDSMLLRLCKADKRVIALLFFREACFLRLRIYTVSSPIFWQTKTSMQAFRLGMERLLSLLAMMHVGGGLCCTTDIILVFLSFILSHIKGGWNRATILKYVYPSIQMSGRICEISRGWG